ncbi:MAG: tRNA (guanine(26)-N(2))-dimethyltransferase, partial [Thermoplasmata archaeon]
MKVEEGSAIIDVPEVFHGPGKKQPAFYNQDQVLNRDITVMFVRYANVKRFLDGFGGSGIRGIRVAKETTSEVTVSEIDRRSYDIIVSNARNNGVDIRILNTDFFCALSSGLYDFVDIDPYGSVVPFLDPALLKVKRNGYIGITATDLSSLTGSTSQKTKRRYEAHIHNDVYRHEMGIRLLCGYVARRSAAVDRAAFPVLSIWHGHYYRIFFKITNGSERADRNLQ